MSDFFEKMVLRPRHGPVEKKIITVFLILEVLYDRGWTTPLRRFFDHLEPVPGHPSSLSFYYEPLFPQPETKNEPVYFGPHLLLEVDSTVLWVEGASSYEHSPGYWIHHQRICDHWKEPWRTVCFVALSHHSTMPTSLKKANHRYAQTLPDATVNDWRWVSWYWFYRWGRDFYQQKKGHKESMDRLRLLETLLEELEGMFQA